MSRTPDRFPGEREDEGIILSDKGSPATVEGEICYYQGAFSMKDQIGVFNPRTGSPSTGDVSMIKVKGVSTTSVPPWAMSGFFTMDGVTYGEGDLFLYKDAGYYNGVYVIHSGAWTRADVMNTSAQCDAGIVCWARQGTANGNKFWYLSTPPPITLDTTALTFDKLTVETGTGVLSCSTTTFSGGTSTLAAREDHQHSISYGDPVDLGTSNLVGSGAGLARQDHVHRHGHDIRELLLFAPDFDDPGANWSVTAPAAMALDNTYSNLPVRLFDASTEEGVGWSVYVPNLVMGVRLTIVGKPVTGPAAVRTVGLGLKVKPLWLNSTPGGWTAYTLGDLTIQSNVYLQRTIQTMTLGSLGMSQNNLFQLELTRKTPQGGTNLTGDFALFSVLMEFTLASP